VKNRQGRAQGSKKGVRKKGLAPAKKLSREGKLAKGRGGGKREKGAKGGMTKPSSQRGGGIQEKKKEVAKRTTHGTPPKIVQSLATEEELGEHLAGSAKSIAKSGYGGNGGDLRRKCLFKVGDPTKRGAYGGTRKSKGGTSSGCRTGGGK